MVDSPSTLLQIAESFDLTGERHNPGVRRRAHHRNAIAQAGERVTRAGTAADIGRARTEDARFRGVGAARSEFDHRRPAAASTEARGFGRDHGWKADGGEQEGFRNLGLDDRARE